jgi:hypothetical protein
MKRPPLRPAAMVLLTLAVLLPAFSDSASAREKQHPAVVHLRHPDGREETLEVSDLHFVYYERRFIRHPAGFGKPGDLEVRDLPHETQSIQDEERTKLKFRKLSRVEFLYREEAGKRVLRVVATRTSKKREPADWPAASLRNTSTARLPHFRGRVGDRTVDFTIPPFIEPAAFDAPVLTRIDILPAVWGSPEHAP